MSRNFSIDLPNKRDFAIMRNLKEHKTVFHESCRRESKLGDSNKHLCPTSNPHSTHPPMVLNAPTDIPTFK